MNYGEIYIHNNVWNFYGDHILIKFFFGFIIDIQKSFKKKRQEPTTLLMFVFYVCKKPKTFFP